MRTVRTDYLSLIRADAELLIRAASDAGEDALVPTCPGWTVRDLVDHVARVYNRVAAIVQARADRRLDDGDLPPTPPFEVALAKLLDTLASIGPDESVWNWSVNQPKTGAFWPRRMACETAIHRVDAQSASSSVTPIDSGLAVEAMDELLDVILTARVAAGVGVELGGSIHFHCTDVAGEWLVSVGDGVVDIMRSHAKGDAAVRGPASDVLLWAYNRLPAGSGVGGGAVETFGSESVLTAWRDVRF